MLPNVNTRLVTGQVDNHPAGILGTASKIDVAEWLNTNGGVFGHCGAYHPSTHGCTDRRRLQHDEQDVAIQPCLVGHRLVQIEHDPRAVASFDHIGRPEIATIQFNQIAARCVGHA